MVSINSLYGLCFSFPYRLVRKVVSIKKETVPALEKGKMYLVKVV